MGCGASLVSRVATAAPGPGYGQGPVPKYRDFKKSAKKHVAIIWDMVGHLPLQDSIFRMLPAEFAPGQCGHHDVSVQQTGCGREQRCAMCSNPACSIPQLRNVGV
jgi:hypothetical protein